MHFSSIEKLNYHLNEGPAIRVGSFNNEKYNVTNVSRFRGNILCALLLVKSIPSKD